mgnify:CR=1 FL=1
MAYNINKKNQHILKEKYKNANNYFDFNKFLENNSMLPIGDLTNTGGTLGKCLTDINKYSDAS